MTTAPLTEPISAPLFTSDHAYLRTHRIRGRSLRFQLSFEESALSERAAASAAGRAGKTLVKEGSLRIVQFALRKGLTVPWREVSGVTSVQVLRGRVRMRTSDGQMDLVPGALVVLDTGVSHEATAMSDCVMLMTISLVQREVCT
jgi:quercetin dioxygenase-like cupin family protein